MSPLVLDTSALIAGLLSRRGAAAALVDALFNDRITLAYTPATLGEYVEVMERPEFSGLILPADRAAIVLKLRYRGIKVTPAAVPADRWPDADDLPFVAAALATEARVIVTLNPADFEPAARHGVRVLSPAQARREFL